MDEWNVCHGHQKLTRNTMKISAITIGQGGVLTDAVEVEMR